MSKIYTVKEINTFIKGLVENEPCLKEIQLQGEVSNCKYASNNHVYFTMKDAQSKINGLMFASDRFYGLKFQMKDGDRVVVTGRISVYEPYGEYRILAKKIERAGVGDLHQQFEELKRRLEEMGMFSPEYKIPIPKYARTVGVVTSQTGAVLQDIRKTAKERNPAVQLVLYPAKVQGEGAAESIVRGIEALERYGVDVMIVGRGGGSTEELGAFNEEIVANAIFNCRVPVVSAVGHGTNETLADLVADLAVVTPTKAAEAVVFHLAETQQKVAQREEKATRIMNQQLRLVRERLRVRDAKLAALSPQNRLRENRKRCQEYRDRMTNEIERLLQKRRHRYEQVADKPELLMERILQRKRHRYEQVADKPELLMEKILQRKRHQFELLAGKLDANSPVKKLSGGYAFVEGPDQKALVSVDRVRQDDEIRVHVLDGSLQAKVTEVNKHE